MACGTADCSGCFTINNDQSPGEQNINSGQLIVFFFFFFFFFFSKIFHHNHRCDQQNYIILEIVTRPFSKRYKMSNKDSDKKIHLK